MRLHLAQAEVRHEILGGAGRDPELGMTEHGPVKIIAVRDGTADAYVVIGGDLVIKDRWRPGIPIRLRFLASSDVRLWGCSARWLLQADPAAMLPSAGVRLQGGCAEGEDAFCELGEPIKIAHHNSLAPAFDDAVPLPDVQCPAHRIECCAGQFGEVLPR